MSLQDDELQRARAQRREEVAQRIKKQVKKKSVPSNIYNDEPKDTSKAEGENKGIFGKEKAPDLLKLINQTQAQDNTSVMTPLKQEFQNAGVNKEEVVPTREPVKENPVEEKKGTLENNEYMAEQKRKYEEEQKKSPLERVVDKLPSGDELFGKAPIATQAVPFDITRQKYIHEVGKDGKLKVVENPEYVDRPLSQRELNEVTSQQQVEWNDKGKLVFPNKPKSNIQQQTEAGITNVLMTSGIDPSSGMGETLKNVLSPIFSGMAQMERGNKENFARDMADKILGLVTIGIGTMPEMIGSNALTDITNKIAMEIGDSIGLPERSSEKLGHVISLAPFGKSIVMAGLMSSTAGEFVGDVIKDTSLDETDKERLIEFASHIGFFGTLGAMNVGKETYQSLKYKYAKENLSDPLMRQKLEKDLEDKAVIDGLESDRKSLVSDYSERERAGTLTSENRIELAKKLEEYDRLISQKEEKIKKRDSEVRVAYTQREADKPTFEEKQTKSNLEKYQDEKKIYDQKIRDYEGDKTSAEYQALKTLQSSTDKAISDEKKSPTPIKTEKDRAEAFGKSVTETLTKDRTGGLDVKTQGFGGKKKDVISERDRSEEERKKGKELAKEKMKDPTKNVSLQTANEYNKSVGLPEVTQHEYKLSDKEVQSKIAGLYPKLQDVNSKDYKETDTERRIYSEYKEKFPDVVKDSGATNYKELVKEAYSQLIREVDKQYEALPIKTTYHKGDKNYEDSAEMLDDVHNYGHMWVYKGGDDHTELGSKTTDKNGLTANEKFRAVHDYFGHSVEGYQFGKHGEENAWIEHSKMFSPLAQWALTSETRGQNSYVNYSGVNEGALKKIQAGNKLKKEGKVQEGQALIDEANKEFNYAEQKAVLLPPEAVSYEKYHSTYIKETPRQLKGETKDNSVKSDHPAVKKVENAIRKIFGKDENRVRVIDEKEFDKLSEEALKGKDANFERVGAFEKKEIVDDPKYAKLIESGHVTKDFDIKNISGKRVVIIHPDNSAVGSVKGKDSNLPAISLEGGVHHPANTDEVWANAPIASKRLSSAINKAREANIANGGDGTTYVVVSRGADGKVLTSHIGAKGTVRVLEHLVELNLISPEDFRRSLAKVGKRYGVEYTAKATKGKLIKELDDKFFGVKDSSLTNRGNFVVDLIRDLTLRSSPSKNIEAIREALNSKSIGRDIGWSSDGITQAIGRLFGDKSTHDVPVTHAYALIEVNHKTAVEESSHPSYPSAVVQLDESGKRVKARLHFLKDANHINDIVNTLDGKPVSRNKADYRAFGNNQTGIGDGIVKPAEELPRSNSQPMIKPNGEIYGFEQNGNIYLKGGKATLKTLVEEAGHVWINWATTNRPDLLEAGYEKVKGSKYHRDVRTDKFYSERAGLLSKEERDNYYLKEALAKAIGTNGEEIVDKDKRKSFKTWLKGLWESIAKNYGIRDVSPEEISKLTLDEFSKKVAVDILKSGEEQPAPVREPKQIIKEIKAKGYEHITPVEVLKDEKLYNDLREVGESVYYDGKYQYRKWREGMRKVLKTDNVTTSRIGRMLFEDIKSGKRSKTLELTHYTARTSDPEILFVDPKKFTTNSRSYSEAEKRSSSLPRSFWMTDDKSIAEKNLYGHGTVYKTNVDPSKVYDLINDPKGYVEKYGNNMDGLLKRLKKEGYGGTYDHRMQSDNYDQNMGVVMLFGKQRAERPMQTSVTISKAQDRLKEYKDWKKLIEEGNTSEAETLSRTMNDAVADDFKTDLDKHATSVYNVTSTHVHGAWEGSHEPSVKIDMRAEPSAIVDIMQVVSNQIKALKQMAGMVVTEADPQAKLFAKNKDGSTNTPEAVFKITASQDYVPLNEYRKITEDLRSNLDVLGHTLQDNKVSIFLNEKQNADEFLEKIRSQIEETTGKKTELDGRNVKKVWWVSRDEVTKKYPTGEEVLGLPDKNTRAKAYKLAKQTIKDAINKDSGVSFMGLSKLSDLTDPKVLKAVYDVAKHHTGKFIEWSKKMINDIGEWVRPHLPAVWDSLKNPNKLDGAVINGFDLSDLHKLREKIIEFRVRRDKAPPVPPEIEEKRKSVIEGLTLSKEDEYKMFVALPHMSLSKKEQSLWADNPSALEQLARNPNLHKDTVDKIYEKCLHLWEKSPYSPYLSDTLESLAVNPSMPATTALKMFRGLSKIIKDDNGTLGAKSEKILSALLVNPELSSRTQNKIMSDIERHYAIGQLKDRKLRMAIKNSLYPALVSNDNLSRENFHEIMSHAFFYDLKSLVRMGVYSKVYGDRDVMERIVKEVFDKEEYGMLPFLMPKRRPDAQARYVEMLKEETLTSKLPLDTRIEVMRNIVTVSYRLDPKTQRAVWEMYKDTLSKDMDYEDPIHRILKAQLSATLNDPSVVESMLDEILSNSGSQTREQLMKLANDIVPLAGEGWITQKQEKIIDRIIAYDKKLGAYNNYLNGRQSIEVLDELVKDRDIGQMNRMLINLNSPVTIKRRIKESIMDIAESELNEYLEKYGDDGKDNAYRLADSDLMRLAEKVWYHDGEIEKKLLSIGEAVAEVRGSSKIISGLVNNRALSDEAYMKLAKSKLTPSQLETLLDNPSTPTSVIDFLNGTPVQENRGKSKFEASMTSGLTTGRVFAHETQFLWKKVAGYELDAVGKSWRINFTAKTDKFPTEVYDIFDYWHNVKSQTRKDNPVGWIGGKFDEKNNRLYITEAQSDIGQRTFEFVPEKRSKEMKAQNVDDILDKHAHLKSKIENEFGDWRKIFFDKAIQQFGGRNGVDEIYIPTREYYTREVPPAKNISKLYDDMALALGSEKKDSTGNWHIVTRDNIEAYKNSTVEKGAPKYDTYAKAYLDHFVNSMKKDYPDLQSDYKTAMDALDFLREDEVFGRYAETEKGVEYIAKDLMRWIDEKFGKEEPKETLGDAKDGEGDMLVDPEGNPIDEPYQAPEISGKERLEKKLESEQEKRDQILEQYIPSGITDFSVDFLLDELNSAKQKKDNAHVEVIKQLLSEIEYNRNMNTVEKTLKKDGGLGFMGLGKLEHIANKEFVSAVYGVGKYLVQQGAKRVVEFTKKLAGEVGDWVIPHAKKIWDELTKDRTGLENVTTMGFGKFGDKGDKVDKVQSFREFAKGFKKEFGRAPKRADYTAFVKEQRYTDQPMGEKKSETLGYNEETMHPQMKEQLPSIVESIRGAFDQMRGNRLTNQQAIESGIEYASKLTDNDVLSLRRGATMNATELVGTRIYTENKMLNALTDVKTNGLTTDNAKAFEKSFLMYLRTRAVGTENARGVQSMGIQVTDGLIGMMKDSAKKIMETDKAKGQELMSMVDQLSKETDPTTRDKIFFWYYNSMLSNPFTDIANVLGNASHLAFETVTSMLYEPSLAKQTVKGVIEGARAGLRDAKLILKEGRYAESKFTGEAREGRRGYDLRPTSAIGKGLKILLPTTRLAIEDAIFSKIFEHAEGERVKKILSKKYNEPLDMIEENLRQVASNPFLLDAKSKDFRQMLQAIDEYKRYGVFQSEGGEFTKSMTALSNTWVGKPIIPFVPIASAILRTGLNTTPLGGLKYLKDRGRVSPRELSNIKRRAIMGTLFYAGLGYLYSQGIINVTGHGANDPNDQDLLAKDGYKPEHLYIKVGDKVYGGDYGNINPINVPLSLLGNFLDDMKYNKKKKWNDYSLIQKTSATMLGFASSFTEQSFMKGVSDLFRAIKEGDPNWLQRFGMSIVTPNVLSVGKDFKHMMTGESNPQVQMHGEDLRYVSEYYKNKTGINTESLTKKYSIFGEEKKSLYERYPIPTSTSGTDKTSQYLLKNDLNVGYPSKSQKIGDREMTESEYNEFLKVSGARIKAELDKRLPELEKKNVEEAQDAIDKIRDTIREAVKEELRSKWGVEKKNKKGKEEDLDLDIGKPKKEKSFDLNLN